MAYNFLLIVVRYKYKSNLHTSLHITAYIILHSLLNNSI